MIEFNATFLIAMLSFVVFIMIMNAIFYEPILEIIRKREDYINSNYNDSQNNLNNAKQLEDERNSQILQTQKKCRNDFNIAIDNFNAASTAKVKEARAKHKEIIQEEKNKLFKNKEELDLALQDSVVENVATSITSKILKNNQIKINQ